MNSFKIFFIQNYLPFLSAACVKFRMLVRQIAPTIEPFEVASTIAKLALELWRECHLQPNMLLNFPEEGLNVRQRQSCDALRFFKLFSILTRQSLRTAEWSIGEKRVVSGPHNYRVDAFHVDERGRKVALEYYGCRFHGIFIIFYFSIL